MRGKTPATNVLPIGLVCADRAAWALTTMLEDPNHHGRLPGQNSVVNHWQLPPATGLDEGSLHGLPSK